MTGLRKNYWKEGEIDFLPILMPVCDRPEYLKEVLDALAKNHDIDKTVLVVSQDGNNKEVEALINNVTLPSRVVHLRHIRPYLSIPSYIHTNEYATAANVKFLLEFAFDYLKAPGAIVLESDLKPSVDMYNYFNWAFQKILKNPRYSHVLNINSFNMDSREDSDPYTLTPAEFTVWGWCTAADRWPLLKEKWTKFGNWDINVQENIRIPHRMVSMTPLLARVKNIGRIGINFDISEEDFYEWDEVYINTNRAISFDGQEPRIVNTNLTAKAVENFDNQGFMGVFN
ncbi:nucleotide-diphospho-sugar transferase [Basidiobolus meristosporus CBS 931.73]|uniref:alpha-1,3-mannosyl-glycoprotein 2-beta-N-acetylglucosaminyltransferase n=1 Tax=Basidiobolus meristosporus CBS 931.73 TaxID=1314790 RepID=A0A1Y1YSC5_9FUNG|nr:nucleotide-diphospho-sugar transferase [Basidiobolus meristosporus CBS 931.73]|eukprot:ORY00928.1 nucleotide-diphospho-sugar transferase [Basidiobolus meristosporus CBS 931.73]